MRLAMMVALVLSGCPRAASDSQDVINIKNVIGDNWITPATIRWVEVRVVETAPAGWVHGEALFDSQNEFGALVRKRVNVIFQVKGDSLYWNKQFGTQTLGDGAGTLSRNDLIRTFKALNDWPGTK